MIPRDYITEWRAQAPWVQDFQVEQDLVISRALIEIFSNPGVHDALAFRGGTALYKLHLKPAARYSEDIDLVQTRAEAAGPMMEALRGILDPWLGKPRYKQTEGRVTFVYRFNSEGTPPVPLKLKVETNTREHFSVYGLKQVPFTVESRWFSGSCKIQSYELDELLGTKLRALYQRKWGRDLFDLATALEKPEVDPARVVASFSRYMEEEGHRITRAQFEKNMVLKLRDPKFRADISPLLATGFTWDMDEAAPVVSSRLEMKEGLFVGSGKAYLFDPNFHLAALLRGARYLRSFIINKPRMFQRSCSPRHIQQGKCDLRHSLGIDI